MAHYDETLKMDKQIYKKQMWNMLVYGILYKHRQVWAFPEVPLWDEQFIIILNFTIYYIRTRTTH